MKKDYNYITATKSKKRVPIKTAGVERKEDEETQYLRNI
jgi:hypothetical protein